MMTIINVELPEETYSQLKTLLKEWNITLDELAEQYLKWVVSHPDEAVLWLREQIEEEYLRYKGYSGTFEYSQNDRMFYGKLKNIKGLLSYEGNSIRELSKNFILAVEYLIYEERKRK